MLTNFYAIQGQRRAVVRGRAGGDFNPSVILGFRKENRKSINISPPPLRIFKPNDGSAEQAVARALVHYCA